MKTLVHNRQTGNSIFAERLKPPIRKGRLPPPCRAGHCVCPAITDHERAFAIRVLLAFGNRIFQIGIHLGIAARTVVGTLGGGIWVADFLVVHSKIMVGGKPLQLLGGRAFTWKQNSPQPDARTPLRLYQQIVAADNSQRGPLKGMP